MFKTLTISPELLKNKELRVYTDFIYGFINNMNWKITSNANVILFSIKDDLEKLNLHNYNYLILISKDNDYAEAEFEGLLSSLTRDLYSWSDTDNNKIFVDIYAKNGTTLYYYCNHDTQMPDSKNAAQLLHEEVKKNLCDDFDLGHKVSILISDSCLVDEIMKKRELNKP